MLFQRLITTLILVPLVLLAIFFGNPWFLGSIVLLILIAAGRECWQLIPLEYSATQVIFLLLLVLATWICGYLFSYWISIGLIVWVFVIVAIWSFPASQTFWGYPFIIASVFLLLLPLFVQSLIHLYYLPQGKSLVVFVLFLIWAADIGAYLAGKKFGKHKLIPQVSPGKSWEGVVGGFIFAMLIATGGYFYFSPLSMIMWYTLAIFTVIISIFGDLFESVLKRRSHLKDTGSILPGHGGILDRLDSLIAALPLFYFGLTYVPIGI